MRLFLLFGIILFCFGCKSENTADTQEGIKIKKLDSLSEEKIKLNLLKLSQEAEQGLESFEDFQNLRTMMQSMRDANPFYANKYADSIDLLINTFEENLSEDFNINTVNSRITVLTTASGLLKLLSEKKNPDAKKVMLSNTKLITAYNSLVVQLNEIYLAIPENIEKELLRDQEESEEE